MILGSGSHGKCRWLRPTDDAKTLPADVLVVLWCLILVCLSTAILGSIYIIFLEAYISSMFFYGTMVLCFAAIWCLKVLEKV